MRAHVVLVGLALALGGCNESFQDVVLDQATDDLRCPRSEIRVVSRGALAFSGASYTGSDPSSQTHTYRVDAVGCGEAAAYACTEWKGAIENSWSCCNMGTPGCY